MTTRIRVEQRARPACGSHLRRAAPAAAGGRRSRRSAGRAGGHDRAAARRRRGRAGRSRSVPGAALDLFDVAGTVAYHGRGRPAAWHTTHDRGRRRLPELRRAAVRGRRRGGCDPHAELDLAGSARCGCGRPWCSADGRGRRPGAEPDSTCGWPGPRSGGRTPTSIPPGSGISPASSPAAGGGLAAQRGPVAAPDRPPAVTYALLAGAGTVYPLARRRAGRLPAARATSRSASIGGAPRCRRRSDERRAFFPFAKNDDVGSSPGATGARRAERVSGSGWSRSAGWLPAVMEWCPSPSPSTAWPLPSPWP